MAGFIQELLEGKESIVNVRTGKTGLECYAKEDLRLLGKANKALLKAFLNGVIEELK